MFNSLRYTKVLEEAGVARKQAEAHVEILSDMMGSHFATTQDLKDLRIELTQEMVKLRAEMQSLEYRLTIKLGTMVGVAVAVLTLVIKLG